MALFTYFLIVFKCQKEEQTNKQKPAGAVEGHASRHCLGRGAILFFSVEPVSKLSAQISTDN